MKFWSALGIVLFVCLLFSSGCTMAKIYGRGATPVMLNNPPQRVEVIKHFEVSKGIAFDFTSAFDASAMLAAVLQETKCDAIINVGLEVKTTVGDFFLNMITLGIANAKHLTVVGDAIAFPPGSSPDGQGIEVIAESDNLQDLTVMLLTGTGKESSNSMIIKSDNGYRLVSLKK